jgi:hypothetical protein
MSVKSTTTMTEFRTPWVDRNPTIRQVNSWLKGMAVVTEMDDEDGIVERHVQNKKRCLRFPGAYGPFMRHFTYKYALLAETFYYLVAQGRVKRAWRGIYNMTLRGLRYIENARSNIFNEIIQYDKEYQNQSFPDTDTPPLFPSFIEWIVLERFQLHVRSEEDLRKLKVYNEKGIKTDMNIFEAEGEDLLCE